MADSLAVVVKISGVGPLTLSNDENGPFGAFSVALVALPQGFTPTDYEWEIDPDTPQELRAVGKEVRLTLSIGSHGSLTYEHRLKLRASNASGDSAKATYTIHAHPPTGQLIPRYDDAFSRPGVRGLIPSSGNPIEQQAYQRVLVEAQTEGLLGRTVSAWKIGGSSPKVLQDSSGLVVNMLVTGDPGNIESYEGVSVEVMITDEIGQSVRLRQFIEAVVDLKTAPAKH